MTRPKSPRKTPAARARPRGARTKSVNGASGREDFGEVIELIADAKASGVFDPENRSRVVARPSATNAPGAPFARIVAGAKTEDQQLRALEAAARNEVALPRGCVRRRRARHGCGHHLQRTSARGPDAELHARAATLQRGPG
jgi:hypothetical protein